MTEEEKKKMQENWSGDTREKFQKGFNKASELPDVASAANDAWKGITELFVPKAQAKKKKEDY